MWDIPGWEIGTFSSDLEWGKKKKNKASSVLRINMSPQMEKRFNTVP